jgi:hypothetical protein
MSKIQLTPNQVLATINAIVKLEGAPSGDPKEAPVSKYNFKAKVLYGLAKNYNTLKRLVEDIESTRQKTLKKYQTEGEANLGEAQAAKFSADFSDFLNTPLDVDLHQVDINEIDLDLNQIPISVLADLAGRVFTGDLK